ncbi:MAG: CTP synthase [Firmicutes bacterium]|nr:CTP synthase [Bacillota bacterium]
MATKYVFITGGVVSGLGKGTVAASLGRLLINRGLKISIQKLDVYLNVDPSMMNPFRHGEVFVTDDGAETDLDVGHYERFTGVHFNKNVNSTMGKVYQSVLRKERAGEYQGRDVQVVPHVTDEIKRVIKEVSKDVDVAIIEVGGTVGEIEGSTTIEAVRQLKLELGSNGSFNIHVTLVPYLECSKEIKTKPTQNSVRDLRHMGINPDVVICRTNRGIEIDTEAREKIALFCNLKDINHVIHAPDCLTVYQVPVNLKEQKLDEIVLEHFGIKAKQGNLEDWKNMVLKMLDDSNKTPKKIAIIGKYASVPDSYISVTEAIKHAALFTDVKADIHLVNPDDLMANSVKAFLGKFDAIVVANAHGRAGLEGCVLAAQVARENNIPYLGIGLGLQAAVVDFAKNVANWQLFNLFTNGKIRLGLCDVKLEKGSKAYNAYNTIQKNTTQTKERHRNDYEFDNAYQKELENTGLVFSGVDCDDLVEIVENPSCKYFIACQFHPELVSKPYNPHPLFVGLIKASLDK